MEFNVNSGVKFSPCKDLIAFKWLIAKPKLAGGLILPESYLRPSLGLRKGGFMFGEVLAIGPEVFEVKVKDKILIHEYGPKNFQGSWNIKTIYFIEEKFIKAILINLKGQWIAKLEEPKD